jgi:hypothetical protein
MVGHEGKTGSCIVLGDDRSTNQSFVQSVGSAMRISTEVFRDLMDASRTLSATLLRYVNVFMLQGSQIALANGRGRLDVRLARWLLMWDDRLRRDTLTVTTSFLLFCLEFAGRASCPPYASRQRPDPLDTRQRPDPQPRGSPNSCGWLLWRSRS